MIAFFLKPPTERHSAAIYQRKMQGNSKGSKMIEADRTGVL
jgi:hypothetical protein